MRVFYLRDKHRRPVTTVASQIGQCSTEPNGPCTVIYYAATWNPKDVLTKRAGREEAIRNLLLGSIHGHIHVTPQTHRLMKERIVKQIEMNRALPQRTREAARRWLNERLRSLPDCVD